MPAIGGLDAHQKGIRIRGRVRSPMANARYFALLQTHVLLPAPPAGELAADRAAVHDALREGRCYLAFEGLAPGRGFRFWAERDDAAAPMGARVDPGRWVLRATAPRRARLRLLRDGVPDPRGRGPAARARRRGRGLLPGRGAAGRATRASACGS